MTMQMGRAFNAKMLTSMTLHKVTAGAFDSSNDWVAGASTDSTIVGRIVAGNKFSQFNEGIALHAEDGGARYSNYRNLYVLNKYDVAAGDQVTFGGELFNVLQESNESIYGFRSFIMEKEEL